MRTGSPFSSSVMDGTVERGARSETADCVRCIGGRRNERACGGEEDMIPVEEVGTGVGYFWSEATFSESETRTWRLAGRGKPGEEENGSNGGSNDGVGAERFTPATGDTWPVALFGVDFMLLVQCLRQQQHQCKALCGSHGCQFA